MNDQSNFGVREVSSPPRPDPPAAVNPGVALYLGGGGLSVESIARVARGSAVITLDPAATAKVSAAHGLAADLSTRRDVYGITTGVGANRLITVSEGSGAGHGMRLLRSHAVGFGPVEDHAVTRATMLVRLNQLLNGGSSTAPEVVQALAHALNVGALPIVHRYGTIGTGDLAPLAEIALTLAGDRPWLAGGPGAVHFGATDALAFISSNALTVTVAALACVDLDVLARASCVVAALSFAALQGSVEAYAEEVHRPRPLAGATTVAATMRRLVTAAGTDRAPRRIQDPFGLRALPQVHGPALDALRVLKQVVTWEINSAVENPLVSAEQDTVYHHGQFYTASVAASLDAVRATLHPVLALSVARLAALGEPGLTGLMPFLAEGPEGSSGTMVLEYVAHDVLAECRLASTPVSLAGAVLSRGLEEHASFSAQAARATAFVCSRAPAVLACELVCAVRALRAAPERLISAPVRAAFDIAAAVIDDDATDRPLGGDLTAAVDALPTLAAI